jgi:L-aminopeptidase/D-esterase-like protein
VELPSLTHESIDRCKPQIGAPVNALNLKRMAARAMLGRGRTGAAGSNGSGDYAIAFSTAPQVRTYA